MPRKPPAPPGGSSKGWQEKFTTDGVAYFYKQSTDELTWDRPDELKSAEERANAASKLVWVRDETDAWLPARVIKESKGKAVVETVANGKRRKKKMNVPSSDLAHEWEFRASELDRLPSDIVLLDHINEASITHVLRERFENGEVYTWVGASRTVLISINPFKALPLYGLDVIEMHRRPPPNKALPPHVFDIASQAYSALFLEGKNQSILISGESGAGKTWSAWQCFSYLAEVAGSENNVETKILKANPILEAFGNAKTTRNNNSSRFGKWIEVHFDIRGQVGGAKITNYLLEKCRVTSQQSGDRNFHIFYQMLKTASVCIPHGLGAGSSAFRYTRGGSDAVDGVDDTAEFQEMIEAMAQLGFSQDESDATIQIAAGVLHLGNVTFNPKQIEAATGGAHVAGSEVAARGEGADALSHAARLLGVGEAEARVALTQRSITVRGTKTVIPLEPAGGMEACDALAKDVYGRLFEWLVVKVNKAIKVESDEGKQGGFIGVLDIFGFEIFECNSFEQLCINFCNEKLQQHFNKATFKLEEMVYQNEEIIFEPIVFVDNQPVLDLIEHKASKKASGGVPTGILILLDDEIKRPGGDDDSFMTKTKAAHAPHPSFVIDDAHSHDLRFTVRHYAGEVVYDAEGWSEKNRDTLWPDLAELCESSESALIRKLYKVKGADGGGASDLAKARKAMKKGKKAKGGKSGGGGSSSKRTLGGQFRKQLDTLMKLLYTTSPSYIRCIKPNPRKRGLEFVAPMCLDQLKFSGVFEAVKIRKQGFPFRFPHRTFAFRYHCTLPEGTISLSGGDDHGICNAILEHCLQKRGLGSTDSFQVGNTMCLYRAKEHRMLELLRSLALETVVPHIQRVMRGLFAREMRRRLISTTDTIQRALDVGNDAVVLGDAITNVANTIGTLGTLFDNMPHNWTEARELHRKLLEWTKVTTLLESLHSVDPNESKKAYHKLASAVNRCQELLEVPHTERQQNLYEEAKAKLDAAAGQRLEPLAEDALIDLEKAKLEDVVAQADEAMYSSPVIDELRRLLALPEGEFMALQIEKAKEMDDPVRRINRTIALQMLEIERDDWKYEFEKIPMLRDPAEFASMKFMSILLKKQKIADGMLVHSSAPIHISLTSLPKEFAKKAGGLHKLILGYCGEKSMRGVAKEQMVADLFKKARMYGAGMQIEVYVQIMKQLRNNPSAESAKKVWELMAVACSTICPPAEFERFLVAFLLNNGEDAGGRWISALHKLRFDDAVESGDGDVDMDSPGPVKPIGAHEVDKLVAKFFGGHAERSRFSVADIGALVRKPKRASELVTIHDVSEDSSDDEEDEEDEAKPLGRAKVLYDFAPVDDAAGEQLVVSEGMHIIVLRQEDDWCVVVVVVVVVVDYTLYIFALPNEVLINLSLTTVRRISQQLLRDSLSLSLS